MNEKNLAEQFEELLAVIDELVDLNSTIPVIVEGSKDIGSLRSLGLKGFIVKINTGATILNTCETLAEEHREVIILTDWDRKGGQLARQLKDSFDSLGVKSNLDIRAKLAYLCRKDIKDVESLGRYVSTLQAQLTRPGPGGRVFGEKKQIIRIEISERKNKRGGK